MPVPDGEDIFMAECITSIQGNGTAVQLGGVGSAQCVQKYLRETRLDPLCPAGENSVGAFKLKSIHLQNVRHGYGAGTYFMLRLS